LYFKDIQFTNWGVGVHFTFVLTSEPEWRISKADILAMGRSSVKEIF